jgi:hypothetical protein
VKPGVPAGTRIALICGEPSALVPVRAVTVTTEVRSLPELVMNALAPLTTHSSPSRTAGCGWHRRRNRRRLGEAERASARPRRGREEALLLLLAAVAEDRVDAEADTGAEGDPDRLVDPAELLDGDGPAT